MKRCPQCDRVETDEALKFCRVDGATLVNDSSAIGEAATAQFGSTQDASEVHTSILPHKTDAGISHSRAPTTVPPASHPRTTQLTKPKRRKVMMAIGVLVTIAVVVGGYFYLSSRRGAAIDSIAVLPFENETHDPESDYLADGLTESIIYRLSQLLNLKVSPRSSVFHYKGKESDSLKVGSELGVAAVLSGRITRSGDQITISTELTDVRNNKLLWGEQYDRKISELLATQRETAREIGDKLKVRISGEDQRLANKHYTESNEAHTIMHSDAFAANPVGVDYDADVLLAEYRNGASQTSLLAMPTGAPAQIPPEHGLI